MKTIRPITEFAIRIEYPASTLVLVGRDVAIWKIDPSQKKPDVQIMTCGALSVYAAASGTVWAEIELHADEEGNPVFDGPPVFKNNEIITRIFIVDVAEVRSAGSFRRGYKAALIDKKLPVPKPLKVTDKGRQEAMA